ncbi:MAG: ATP-binding protein [Cytophagales bacterium]|nr:MAG: ATP-binding protein [Cytophagales bacterium]
MELYELKKLVKEGEGQYTEFKLKANHPEKIIKEMIAFANAEGGVLLVGIADNKEIVGLKYPKEDEYVINKALLKHCTPPINYLTEVISLADEREVLAYYIEKSEKTPHAFIEETPQKQIQKKVYIRVADKCIQASKEMREILKGRQKSKDMKFQFGEKEKQLMEFLEQHEFITLEKFAKIAQISKKIASRTLVLLVLAKVLDIIPNEQEDLFLRHEK